MQLLNKHAIMEGQGELGTDHFPLLPKGVILYCLCKYLSLFDRTRLRGTCKRLSFLIKDGGVEYKGKSLDEKLGLSAFGGHRDLVELFILEGARNFDKGLTKAALGGHIDLVEFFILKGALRVSKAVTKAVLGGHQDIVDLLILKAAEDNYRIMREETRMLIDWAPMPLFPLKGGRYF